MSNKCLWVLNQLDFYTIPEFAALWCGVPKENLHKILSESKSSSSTSEGAMYQTHKNYPCLEPRCRLIVRAIKEGKLITFDEKERQQPLENIEHTSWARKRLRPDKVIEWLQDTDMPVSELPKFIYEQESNSDELNAKRENSYRIILYTLLKKIGHDPFPSSDDGTFKFNRNITSWIQNRIEEVGLFLDDDIIRDIVKGLQYLVKKDITKYPK